MPKLLNNTQQTFRALGYDRSASRPVVVDLAVVPPGFSDLTDEQYQAFKAANQEALDCGWIVVNDNKKDETKADVQPLDKPKKKKSKKKKDVFKDFD